MWTSIWTLASDPINSRRWVYTAHSVSYSGHNKVQAGWLQFSSVQLLSRVQLFATPWIAALQVSLSIINSRSLLKLMPIESVMPSSHLILCRPLLLLPPNPPQHQGLFQWVSSSHEVAKVLEFQLQHQSIQWTPRTDLLQDGLIESPCSPRDSQESSPTPQFKSINFSALSFLYSPTLTSIYDHWKNHSLRTIQMCCLTALEARSSKWRYWQGHPPLEDARQLSVSVLSLTFWWPQASSGL